MDFVLTGAILLSKAAISFALMFARAFDVARLWACWRRCFCSSSMILTFYSFLYFCFPRKPIVSGSSPTSGRASSPSSVWLAFFSNSSWANDCFFISSSAAAYSLAANADASSSARTLAFAAASLASYSSWAFWSRISLRRSLAA